MTTPLPACCAMLCLALTVAPVRAQTRSEPTHAQQTTNEEKARRHYEQGLALYEDSAFDAALGELLRAYELRPAPILLYNIATVQRARNDYAAALLAFQQYLASAGAGLAEQRRSEVDEQLKELRQRVAQVTVVVDVDGAEILVDNRLAGTSPLREHLLVNSGLRFLTVQHPAHSPQNRQLSLAGADSVEVAFTLSPQDARQGSRANSEQERQPLDESRRRRGLVISWGITGAFAASALGCAVAAIVRNGQLGEQRNSLDPDTVTLNANAANTRRLAIATDVLLAGTLGAGAFSLWWTLRDRQPRSANRSLTMNLRISPNSTAFALHY